MDLPRLEAMNAYWKKHPPLHLMVAAYLGIGDSKDKPLEEEPDLLMVLGQFPQGMM